MQDGTKIFQQWNGNVICRNTWNYGWYFTRQSETQIFRPQILSRLRWGPFHFIHFISFHFISFHLRASRQWRMGTAHKRFMGIVRNKRIPRWFSSVAGWETRQGWKMLFHVQEEPCQRLVSAVPAGRNDACVWKWLLRNPTKKRSQTPVPSLNPSVVNLQGWDAIT